jgi:hypothetical protein
MQYLDPAFEANMNH